MIPAINTLLRTTGVLLIYVDTEYDLNVFNTGNLKNKNNKNKSVNGSDCFKCVNVHL